MMRRILVLFFALALAGCFDLDQKISLNRDGSGVYEVTITADGMIGEAIKKEALITETKGTIARDTEVTNGHVVHRERVSFRQLPDLDLQDEDVSLTVGGREFFGLGPAHLRFLRTVHSAGVEASHGHGRSENKDSEAALAALFGDHTYSFSVTLPGTIDRIVPVKLGGVTVEPKVTGDFYHGHTITWRMPLHMMFAQDNVTFEVYFSAFGAFEDSHSSAHGDADNSD